MPLCGWDLLGHATRYPFVGHTPRNCMKCTSHFHGILFCDISWTRVSLALQTDCDCDLPLSWPKNSWCQCFYTSWFSSQEWIMQDHGGSCESWPGKCLKVRDSRRKCLLKRPENGLCLILSDESQDQFVCMERPDLA